ncbi:MAG TPA: hypothetical protein VFP70_08490 [Burkholderiales bacterium]|nr:hypothetical protein [Burkholderiales bacterium]
MEQHPCLKCPVEVYGAEIAAEVLPHVYDDQPECARTHGCVHDRCLLEGCWPENPGKTPLGAQSPLAA